MRVVSDLRKVNGAVRRRLVKIRMVLLSCPRSDEVLRNALLTWAMIELDNLIINLFRQFLVSSLLCCRTASGHRITHGASIPSQVEAALFVMSVIEPKKHARFVGSPVLSRRDESTIRNPAKIMQVATAASLSNLPSVVNALSFPTTVFAEISSIRHFFAHRNEQTATAAIGLGLSRGFAAPLEAWRLVDSLLPGQPYTLLDEWIDDVDQFHQILTA